MIGTILLGAGFIQSVFLGLYFYREENKGRKFSRDLGFLFFFLSIIMICNLVYFSGNLNEFPHLIKLGYGFGFSIAPFFSFAVTRYFGIPKENRIWFGLFLLVPILFFIFHIPFFLLNGEKKLLFLKNTLPIEVFSESNLLQMMTLFFSLIVFMRTRFRFQLVLSEFPKDFLREGKLFSQYILLLVFWLFLCILLCIFIPGQISESISNIGFSVWILGFAWHRIYLDQKEDENHQIFSSNQNTNKYQKSYLSDQKLTELGKQFDVLLNDKNTISDGDLTLNKISEILGVSSHTTSQVCNRYYGQSLIEIIREKRITLAKIALLESETPVLRIGFDIGFNSKNAFNRAFKELTQLTPSEYRRKYKS
ncbi:helix-turn-helix transcriptional regulator [Leptospira bandrabouensis]|uniref:AraC family transcriptional regulator n=1 Tax=Leptospira bandrabouensis TaxID=2484903 RepID=A0A6H3NU54_9LEPT|nr:AraC family transcriptional regulator [Leptospira bandrabouensis]MCG6153399.1 AraC family transcriptional regulator [Leptospira bandrabouensis]TGN06025.1 AraC family transcriptional regulator [Leptospira bandrabouensis]TGN16357.1 AraC family transcriptional regulator [Leptospira bandrabouensis]